MHKHSTAFILLSTLILSACSGSGGGSSDSSTSHSSVQTTPVNSIIAADSVNIRSGGSINLDGVDIQANNINITEGSLNNENQPVEGDLTNEDQVNSGFEQIYEKQANFISSSLYNVNGSLNYNNRWGEDYEFNTLVIDENTEIELFPASVTENSFVQDDASGLKMLERGNYTLSGVISVPNADGTSSYYSVVQAKNPTTELPTNGVFDYQGKGFHAHYVKESGLYTFVPSDVKLSADFQTKVIQGEVSSPDNSFTNQKLEANFTQDNAFKGEVDGVTLIGGFFGNNAEEVSGRYHSNSFAEENKEKAVLGVFNATKQ